MARAGWLFLYIAPLHSTQRCECQPSQQNGEHTHQTPSADRDREQPAAPRCEASAGAHRVSGEALRLPADAAVHPRTEICSSNFSRGQKKCDWLNIFKTITVQKNPIVLINVLTGLISKRHLHHTASYDRTHAIGLFLKSGPPSGQPITAPTLYRSTSRPAVHASLLFFFTSVCTFATVLSPWYSFEATTSHACTADNSAARHI